MNNLALNNFIRFFGLILLQVFVLNQVNLFGFVNPMVYILWVVLYPIKKEQGTFLLLSFLLGIFIDIFMNSGGINAAATLFIAFIRMPILKMILGKSDFDFVSFNLRAIAFNKAFFYISFLTFLHHFIIFGLEYFSFSEFTSIISKTLLTSIFTILISIIGILLFSKKK
ncbi:rod shape-determining protein MreD [Lutibacter sp.]|uniref:rod shape-determining protein MreD n=1 Tax=Lutibacter sp. TaxID=1925666 RepID=UPI0027334887|nr:rod shape-determining protein MreD [Lutibacter sp.]MDP3311738.1 rod shape-determining protein MreD [Lutibacter sp.]